MEPRPATITTLIPSAVAVPLLFSHRLPSHRSPSYTLSQDDYDSFPRQLGPESPGRGRCHSLWQRATMDFEADIQAIPGTESADASGE